MDLGVVKGVLLHYLIIYDLCRFSGSSAAVAMYFIYGMEYVDLHPLDSRQTLVVLPHGHITASFPLVYRWGRDVHCIVSVLGKSSHTQYVGHSSACNSLGEGAARPVVKTEPPKASGRLLCETNHASLTNKCLTAPAVCTVPDPSPRPSALHDFSSSTTRHTVTR